MDSNLKKLITRLYEEVKKDIYFFGACGFFVGILFISQSRLKELGILRDPKFASDLFKDFLSINAFIFVFVAYVILSWTNHFITCSILDKTISPIGEKLHQFGSSIVSFAIGFSFFVFSYSVIFIDIDGFKLFFVIFLFALFIINTVVLAEFSAKIKDFSFKIHIFFSILLIAIYLLIRLTALK